MWKCSEIHKFHTRDACTVVDAVVSSDDDDWEKSDFSAISKSTKCSCDGKTQLDDRHAVGWRRDGSVVDSDANSACSILFAWWDRASVLRQRFPFSGSPGRRLTVIIRPMQFNIVKFLSLHICLHKLSWKLIFNLQHWVWGKKQSKDTHIDEINIFVLWYCCKVLCRSQNLKCFVQLKLLLDTQYIWQVMMGQRLLLLLHCYCSKCIHTVQERESERLSVTCSIQTAVHWQSDFWVS